MTERSFRALILDDQRKWRDLLSGSLTRVGFEVTATASPSEFITAVDQALYHLLVFDISMDGTPENQDGLDVLADLRRQGVTDSAVVVVVTGYDDLERVHHMFVDYRIDDVFEKDDFDNLKFVARVTELLQKIHLNRKLSVTWNGTPETSSEILDGLRINGERVKPGSTLHERLVRELDDLLARVFCEAEAIIVSPVERGRSGSGVVRVEPFFTGGAGRPVILKFGDVHEIQTEKDNHKRYVERLLRGGRATNIVYEGQTPLLGAIGYSLLGTEEYESFSSFYTRSGVDRIRRAIENLFLDTCGGWYENQGKLQARDLALEYRQRLGCTEKNITDAISNLKRVQGGDKLTFQGLTEPLTLRNPLRAVFHRTMAFRTYECVTHGDLNDGNIFVDKAANTWLIDFFQTGPGHVLRDFALLDVAVRCSLIDPQQATLDERLELERALLGAQRTDFTRKASSRFASRNEAIQKAFAVCLYIRALAAKCVHHHISADIAEYHTAVLFYALNLTRFMHLHRVQREHALLVAALTGEHLGL